MYRAVIVDFLGSQCEECTSTRFLELHHKDGDRDNNQMENMQLLCRACHQKKKHKNKVGMTLRCRHEDCGYEWKYNGQSTIYATCPGCQRRIKIAESYNGS